MPAVLLPASAQAFAARGQVNVVLGSKVEPWLTATLKRINKIKRPLNSVPQHTRCLTDTLSGSNAIWSLCSIMLPKAPDAELKKDTNPLVEALFNYQLTHIEAYVVLVDMVSQNEVAFKLTQDTIDALVEHHKDVFSSDTTAACSWSWPDKDTQLKKLQDEFVQAANKFVYRTGALCLEGLEEDGAGELLCGRSEDVRSQINALFVPLLPPPPKPVEIVRPTPILPSSAGIETWWPSQHIAAMTPVSVDAWRIVPSSPSPVSSCDSHRAVWTGVGMPHNHNIPSPTPSFSQPFSSATYSDSTYYTASPSWSSSSWSVPAVTTAPSISPLPLPSMLASQHCGSTVNQGFNWDKYAEYSVPFATVV